MGSVYELFKLNYSGTMLNVVSTVIQVKIPIGFPSPSIFEII